MKIKLWSFLPIEHSDYAFLCVVYMCVCVVLCCVVCVEV